MLVVLILFPMDFSRAFLYITKMRFHRQLMLFVKGRSGAVSGCEKNWLERERSGERSGRSRSGERGAGDTEIGLSDERKKFCRSRSAHMLWPHALAKSN